MKENYSVNKIFEKVNYTEAPLPAGEYENCQFIGCNFSNTNFSLIRFTDCVFTSCNLSMVKLGKTVLMETVFKDCKMLGLHFEHCSEFGLSFRFENCVLNHASFYGTKIKGTIFSNCELKEVDFTEADAGNAIFDGCNLEGAVFENTVLEKADFSTAYNYSIDPAFNKIKKAKFSSAGLYGLLSKYDIELTD